MMSCQGEIPFKSRKRTYLGSKKEKLNIENVDILNVNGNLKKTLKRCNVETIEKVHGENNDSFSAKKSAKTQDATIVMNSVEVDKDKMLLKLSSKEKQCLMDLFMKFMKVVLVLGSSTSLSVNEDILKPLVSREKEMEFLKNFLSDHLDSEKSPSLYVSGQPGTGKTACLSYVLRLPQVRLGYQQVYVNCTMMKSASSIYNRICKELGLAPSGSSEKACLGAIEKFLRKKHKMILLVLDEIDQLDSKRQSVLYTIFEWASISENRLVLVGVANALDLTERTLPRLQARGLKPSALHFAPYTKQQIINIFTSVLANEANGNVFSPVALQMLAAKIASISGDMRRALDIGRRVVDLARRNKFSETKSVDTMMKDTAATVELKQVLEVLNNVYGGSANIEADVQEGLPLQQKLILCSLILILNKGNTKEIQVGKLHDVYKKVCAERNIGPLELGELAAACALLEARGALTLRNANNGGARARRLQLRWDEAELRAVLRDKPLLAAILQQH